MLIAARSSQDFACCARARASARSKYASAFAASGCGDLSAPWHFQFSINFSYLPGFNIEIFPPYLETASMRERRKNFRVEWHYPAKIYDRNGRLAWLCIVSNLSNGGAKIAAVEPSKVPDSFILRISPHGRPYECHVIRRSKDGLGVEFTGNDRGMNEPEQRRRRKAKRKQETSAIV